MKIALTGLIGSGKTSFLKTLLDDESLSNEKIATIKVYDERVVKLSQIFNPKKTTFADIAIEEYDINKNTNFDKIKQNDLLIFLINAFSQDENSALKELLDIECEYNIYDLNILEKRLDKLHKENSKNLEYELLSKIKNFLDKDENPYLLNLTKDEKNLVNNYKFFYLKPKMVVLNVAEEVFATNVKFLKIKDYCDKKGYDFFTICVKLEEEIKHLAETDKQEFLKAYNIDEPLKHVVIKNSYNMLDYISFFTVGADEVKAWTIKKGLTAKESAGKIHSDLEKGFIRAEVIDFETFMLYKDLNKAKSEGKVRLEGKDYIVKDGDILHIRFNV